MDNFLFAELGTGAVAQFDGMSAGSFTDMRGKRVSFDPAILSDYVANTMSVIESTRTAKGELVGLPIDLDGHDHKGGAGWIKGVALDPVRNIVTHDVEWTEAGKGLIESNTRRFYSPTVDIGNKVILGGSLTNWPATRDALGRMMLRPVELSAQLQEIEPMDNPMEKLLELGNKFLAYFEGKKPEPTQETTMEVTQTVAEFMQTPEAIAELESRTQSRVAELLKAEQLKSKVAEFAARLTGGNEVALSMKAEDLTAALLALPEAEKVIDLIGKVWDAKLVDFQEKGHGREQQNKQAVPAEIKAYLTKWVAAGKEPADFFTANPELGLAADYDLVEFTKEK